MDNDTNYIATTIIDYSLDKPIASATTYVKPTKRGVRIWIEGAKLAKAGFNWHAAYTRTIENGVITLALNSDGEFKTAGRNRNGKELPIIDISAASLSGFTVNQQVSVEYHSAGMIQIRGL